MLSTPVYAVRAAGVIATCHPISSIFLFPLVDEADLDRFQSGLVRADGTKRPSFDAVESAIAQTRNGCVGRRVVWHHRAKLLGVKLQTKARILRLRAPEEVRYDATVVPVGVFGGGTPLLRKQGVLPAYRMPQIRLALTQLFPGRYRYVVRVQATMNPRRTAVLRSRAFVVRAM